LDNPQEAHMDAQAEKALLLAILIQSVRDMRGRTDFRRVF
jgi:hypothetical protein